LEKHCPIWSVESKRELLQSMVECIIPNDEDLSASEITWRGVFERNYGFPQEFSHYTDCVLNDKQPLVTGGGRPGSDGDHLRGL